MTPVIGTNPDIVEQKGFQPRRGSVIIESKNQPMSHEDSKHKSLGKQKITIAERIEELKMSQKLQGDNSNRPSLFNSRSRSIDPSNSRKAFASTYRKAPLSLAAGGPPRQGISNRIQLDEIARRFKNISDREAPVGHISN